MRRLISPLCAFALVVFVCLAAAVAPASPWHHPLYLAGDGYWRGRVRVVVHNETDRPLVGRPVGVEIGGQPGMANLTGTPAEAIRLCNEQGVEMLFGLNGPDDSAIITGPVPVGATLVIPAECGAKGSAVYYVCFDNPSAGRVPDMLSSRAGLVNGDVEHGQGLTPTGWQHDAGDAQHRATLSSESPQSGRRCLKTVVSEGAEPSWISTRQDGIAVVGGASYLMRAWVKAKDVVGETGWYIHLGNRENPMLAAPMLHAGQGTFDWKQVSLEFTAPADADKASLGTVLRGTGTAWFDNVTWECRQPGRIRAVAEEPQRMVLREIGGQAAWPQEPANGQKWQRRIVVKVLNFASEETTAMPAWVDVSPLVTRSPGPATAANLRVTYGGKQVVHALCDDRSLCFNAEVPARSACTYYVYYCGQTTSGTPPQGLETLLTGNLVENPSFSQGDGLPARWNGMQPGEDPNAVTFTWDNAAEGAAQNRCARLHVSPHAPEAWRGWRQSVPVEPGQTYLLSARVKGENLAGDVHVHLHCHNAAGALCSERAMQSIGPPISGTSGWRRMSGLLVMPDDAATAEIHLTMNTSGTLWHDDIVFSRVVRGAVVGIEGQRLSESSPPAIWPVDAIIKVFREDPLPEHIGRPAISLARNEQEPLQLAVRGGRDLPGLRVEVDPPLGPDGARLDDVRVNVVGYVPIDHPTNYYRSEAPAWHRKYPQQPGSCDGWAGNWPDPLLPRDTFDLEANQTQPVWITVRTAKDTPPGDYLGRVRLSSGGKAVAGCAFSVHVWDFTLPDENHVAAIYDVRLGPGQELWGKDLDELYPEITGFMAEHRLCPDTIRPAPDISYENGRVVADFAAFDKAAAYYFEELKLPHAYTPWSFYLFGWAHPPDRKFGELPYDGEPPFEGVDRSRLRPEFIRAYQACLRTYWEHLKQKGWQDRVVLYIADEPHDWHPQIITQMKALCKMIHEVDPAIPIYSSTWRHVPAWDGSIDVWGIGHQGLVPVGEMAKLRSAGDRIWFTTDGQMCTDTPYCAVERLLPHYCFKYGAEAYEFWGVSWLTYDPYRYGWHAYISQSDYPGNRYWVRYPNGDGFLLYPGRPIGYDGLVSSIRLEQAREGVEDYEYLYLLRSLTTKAKAAGNDVGEAEAALKQADRLVTIPNPGGRYSSRILPRPEAVTELKEAVARAIERLATLRAAESRQAGEDSDSAESVRAVAAGAGTNDS